MKKALSLALTSVLLCSILASCGGSTTSETESTETESTATETTGGEEASTGELNPEDITGTIQYAFWGDELERQQKEEFCAAFTDI